MRKVAFTVLAFLLAESSARAQVGVVELEAEGGTETAAKLGTQALRHAVRGLGMRLGPAKTLAELKLVFGCEQEQPACMAQAARTMGVSRLVWGRVRRRGRVYIFALRALNVAKPSTVAKVSFRVPVAKLTRSSLAAMAPTWLQRVLGVTRTGRLLIRGRPAGAVVHVDGRVVGPLPATGKLPLELPPGRHTVEITKENYRSFRRTVRIRLGRETSLTFELRPVARPRPEQPARVVKVQPEQVEESLLQAKGEQETKEAAEAGKKDRTQLWWQVAFYTTAGLAAVSLAAWAGFGIAWLKKKSDADSYVDSHGYEPGPNQSPTEPCSPDWPGMGDYCSEGRQYGLYAGIFGGIGLALAAGAAAISYFAFFKEYKQETQEAEGPAEAGRLRFVPSVGPGTGAVSVELRF